MSQAAYKKWAGITHNRPKSFSLKKRPKKLSVDRPYALPTALEARLRAWWQDAREAGNLGLGATDEEFDYHVGRGDRKWPEWVWVGALAMAAGRATGHAISKQQMGNWLITIGVSREKKRAISRDYKGKIKYQTIRTYYWMHPFRKRHLDVVPSDVVD